MDGGTRPSKPYFASKCFRGASVETAMQRLSKRLIDNVQPRNADLFLWDGDLSGFGCRIYPSGKRAYLIQYRKAGRTRRYTIGLHGRLTPEEARRQAKILLGRVAHGEDVAELRALDHTALTLSELCDRYLAAAEHAMILGRRNRPKKPSTLATDRGRIARHIKPLLGTRKVKDLTRPDIKRFMDDVRLGKTKADVKTKTRGRAIVRGGAGTASRTIGLLGGIFSYAVEIGLRVDNPVHGIRKPADNRRSVRLSTEQYRALGKALTLSDAAKEHPTAAALCWGLALTGCRRGELGQLRWPEIDFEHQCLDLADTKTGESLRPIGEAALEFLKRQPKTGVYVFPNPAGERPYSRLAKLWPSLVKAAGLPDLTPHGLRHAYASVAGDLGYNELTIAALLGHRAGSVTSGYVHLDKLLIEAANQVAGRIWLLMTQML